MKYVDSASTGLVRVIGRFPDQKAQVCRLYLQSATFRGLCDDLVLAQNTLARFKTFGGENRDAEIADYSRLIPELEAEIGAMLALPPGEGASGN